MSKTKPIDDLVDNLPTSNMTVYMLRALDSVVPGEWQNLVGFKDTVRAVTGETEKKTVKKIRDRALELYADPAQGYQRAMWIYQTVDSADSAIGAAAMANKIGEKIGFLSFLNKLTPKADTLQSIDLCLKLVAELLAVSAMNRISITNINSLAGTLTQYHNESLMRIAALICVDGIIPLGPDFIKKVQSNLGSLNPAVLQQNSTYQNLSNMIPGGSVGDKIGFINQSFGAMQGWMGNFVNSHHITQQGLLSNLQKYMDIADSKLDYVAAFLDMTTNYYEHTGTQTVARRVIERAAREI
ncbi:MAG TPA: hypothetical protein DDW76_02605 [Cyanobacteria bacterium UBA11369]|nr:hypothetical protein [Cyanobacteria bacterium UBA11371]HBE33380.1 hypothetical protein [Cyanobacteria bacterium UBA11368]HBE47720.1 hypothetical protein [Cyanobacteria bacterium UBA11369]